MGIPLPYYHLRYPPYSLLPPRARATAAAAAAAPANRARARAGSRSGMDDFIAQRTSPTVQWDFLSDYEWRFRPEWSCDENFMDLCYRLARNSICVEGHMGCAIVRDPAMASGAAILARSTNAGISSPFSSETHAEANALSDCARRGVATDGATCYVTRAPCSACFHLLARSGIRRIVCPQTYTSDKVREVCERGDIAWVELADPADKREARDREAGALEDPERIAALRKKRKELKAERAALKKRRREDGAGEHR